MVDPKVIPPREELLRILLLGTLQGSGAVRSDMEVDDPESILWEQVAKQDLLQRAARPWPTFAGQIPPPPPPDTQNAACSWRSVRHLEAMLNGHHDPAIPEFIRLLNHYKRQLPPTALPQLFQVASENPDLWEVLEPAIGARGRWLAKQHPVWSQLMGEGGNDQWTNTPEGEETVKQFRAFRQIKPVAARESLVAHWDQYSIKTQARLLDALEAHLSLADEEFLHPLLQAGRKEIRKTAALLLARLPESQYVQLLQDEAADILQYQNDTWSLQLPERVPEHAKWQGISPRGSKLKGGMVLNWFTQVLARIPLPYWAAQSNRQPRDIIRRWLALPHGLALVQASAESLLRHPHEEWTYALIRYWLDTNNEHLWQQPAAKQVLQQASSTIFNDCLLPWLEQYGPLVPEDSLPAYWLSQGKQAWSPRLSRIVVEGFRDVVRERRVQQWSLYHYQRIFQAAAYQSDVSIFPQLRQNWQSGGGGLGRWSVEIEKLLQTLYFRLEMSKELATTDA